MPEDPKPLTKKDFVPAGRASSEAGVLFGGKSQSQYDVGSLYTDLPDLNAVRARNQGFWDGLGNTGVNLLSTLLGQTIETVGAFTDPVYNWTHESELDVTEGIGGIGASIQKWGQEQHPIYYDPKDGVISMDYILSHLPSVVSAAAMLVPGWGLGRGAGLLARAARMGKLGEEALTLGVGSLGMRHAENWMESAQTYNQIMKEGIEGMDPRFEKLGYEEIENAAKVGAATTYANNRLNIIFDMMQMGALMKPLKGLTGWTNVLGKESKLAQTMDYGYKMAVEKGLLKDASRFTKSGLFSMNAIRPFLQQTTEGFEEAWNEISQKEGHRAGLIAAGVEQDDGSNIFDRMRGYLKDGQVWDSAFWGVIGGVTFQAGGQKLNQLGAKAGWWADTTTQGQMLADNKVRADVITQGYKDLANPNYTEYDKAKVKGNMLFNLVKSSKSRESLDMLEEDLDNPAMVKNFAEKMGLKEEDTQKEMASIKEDIKFINDQIDFYTGATTGTWFGKPGVTHTGVGLEEDKDISTPAVRPFRMTRDGKKVPFIYDPRAAQMLAYNDYSIRVKDKLNQQATAEMLGLQKRGFEGTELDNNAQSVFNLISDMAALTNLLNHEKADLADRQSRKISEVFIKASESRVAKTQELYDKRKKQLEETKAVMESNVESGISATTFQQATKHAILVMGAQGTTTKHSKLKGMYYAHLLDKEEALQTNNSILNDPKKFIADYIESDASNKIFEETKKAEAERVKAEQTAIDTALDDLQKETNATYAAAHKRQGETIDDTLTKYATPEDKEAYLRNELAAVKAEQDKHTKDGKFARTNMAEFTTSFDKELYTQLKARENALNTALKPYMKAEEKTTATAAAAGAKQTVKKQNATKDQGLAITKQQFDEGTPGHYYQGMVRAFGEDGKAGIWNRRFLNSDAGLLDALRIYETYSESTDKLANILERYVAAAKAQDPNARVILEEANEFIQESDWQYSTTAPEAKLFADLQRELDNQEATLEKAEKELLKPVTESNMWSTIGGVKGGLEASLNIKTSTPSDAIATLPTFYPEVYKFVEGLVKPYANSFELAEALTKVNEEILTELNRSREAYAEVEAKVNKTVKSEVPATEDAVSLSMDQKNADINTKQLEPSSIHFTNSDKVLPSNHAKKVTDHRDWVTVFVEDKQQSNPDFDLGYTIFVGEDGSTMNGFVKRGMGVVFTWEGDYHGKDEYSEKKIKISNADGVPIGDLDTVYRLKKTIATLTKKVNNPNTTPDDKERAKVTIEKYKELSDTYIKMRNTFKNKGDQRFGEVANNLTTAENNVESGGVRFGNLIKTQEDDKGKHTPIDIHSAFVLDQINKKGGVYLSIYADGRFLVWSPSANKYVNIEDVHSGISIPSFSKNPQTLSGTGTLNGSIFALVPTNTFDQLGNRIYMSVKQATRKITNINLTSNGSFEGKTIPEQILDAITNPDAYSEEFRMLAASVNVPFKPEFRIDSPQNKDNLMAFYTTENLLEIFNRVIYMYDSTVGAKRFMGRDYTHHIGLSVFEDSKTNKPVLRFDLSNDASKENTYAIRLYDENGQFNPQFGLKKVTAEKVLAPELQGNLGQLQTTVNVKDEIVKRLRQKLARVDGHRIGNTAEATERNQYKALVFHQGRLVEQPYDSYLHYLADKQVIESTVHGVDFVAKDPITKVKKTGRTYFDNQNFWFDVLPAGAVKQPDPPGPSANNASSRTLPVAPVADEDQAGHTATPKKKGRPAKFKIPEEIKKSIALRKKGKIKIVGEGAKSYYDINGVRYERLSHVLKEPTEVMNDSIKAGRVVDTAIKQLLAGEPISELANLTEKAGENLEKGVNDFKKHLASVGQQIIGTDIVVYGTVKGRDGVTRNIAGETDIMTVDQKGLVYIYDFKSSGASFSVESYQYRNPTTGESRYENNQQQLSGYSGLLAGMTGEEAAGIGIVPFTVAHTRSGNNVLVEAVVPYDPIIFPDMAYVGVTDPDVASTEEDVDTDITGELTDDELNDVGNDMVDLTPTDNEFWMADLQHPSTISSFIDVGRFRDSGRSYYEQKAYEDYTSQMMLDVLYNHQFVEKNKKKPSYAELLEMTKEFLNKKIDIHRKIIRDVNNTGGIMRRGVRVPYSTQMKADKIEQLKRMQDLKKSLKETPDFVGYGKAGFMILSANDIVDVDVDIEEIIVKGPEDQPYSIRYQENYSVKINPKTTIGTHAKIFLSRVPELQRTIVNGQVHFQGISNLFGIRQYMPVDSVLDTLYIDFEGVAPERFMDKLAEMNHNNPIIRSVMQTLREIERTSPERSNQIRHQLTTLLKQRRDMKFLKVETDDNGDVNSARVIDAARLGVKNNIIKEWENGFRAEFNNLFKLDEKNGDLRSTNHTATPRKINMNYTEKDTDYDTAEFKLPKEFDPSTHPTVWQIEWLYNNLKSIAEGSQKKKVTFSFSNGALIMDGHQLGIGQSLAAQMLLLFQSDKLVIDSKMSHLFEQGDKANKYRKDTYLEQIVANINYFSQPSRRGVVSGDPNAPKDAEGYAPIYYKIMADQMKRAGIQLSEQASESWTVLQDMNSPLNNSQRRKYKLYDPRADDFNNFIVDKIGKLTILPLLEPNAFTIGQQELMDEDGGEFMETQKTINIETPFGHSLQGLDPFARHARSEWYSYINSTIRNAKGDLEFTYTDPNGLSTMLAKLKDGNNGYLQQIAATPMGRHNIYIQNLLRSKDALDALTLHYVDAGKIDNYSVIEPDLLNSAKSHLLVWNNYYNNETKTEHRNKGGFITTHSDSSIMPIFNFDKQTVPLQFVETIAEDGTRSYKVRMTEFNAKNEENQAYKHLYGMFRGELQRIHETFMIWEDIQNQGGPTDADKIEYAFKNYTMGSHFNFEKGVLSKGNGIHLFQFGSTLYKGDNSGLYTSSSKEGLKSTLFDAAGNPNEANIKSTFDKFVNSYLNEMIDDAYNDLVKMDDGFFTVIRKKAGVDAENADSNKTTRIVVKPTLLDATATAAMETIFKKNAVVVNPEGISENVTLRNTPIERDYKDSKLKQQGMSEDEIAVFQAERNEVRKADEKAATYSELFMRYLVSDMAINHSIFYGSLFAMMMDPAVMEGSSTYEKFKDVFDKRMKGPVSPGKVDYFADNEPVRVLPFEDILGGDIKISIADVKMLDHEKEFIAGFDKNIGTTNGKYPARIFDYMSFYYGLPAAERDGAWKVIKDRMADKITDGGSYMSTREWLYRAYRKGDITKKEYFETLDYYYEKKGDPAAGAKILKYVYAGNNIVNVGSSYSNIYSYIKDSQMPMLPNMFEGTVFDALRQQVDEVEKIEYAGSNKSEPTPGIILLPRSSFKTGFSSVAKVIDEDGQPTRDLLKTRVLHLNRGYLREQIQAPDEKDKRATITAQGNVLVDLNAVASVSYGKRGDITFSRMQAGEPVTVYDDDGKEVDVQDSGTGISSNVLQNATVYTITELAKRRLTDKMYELGLSEEKQGYVIDSVSQFLAKMKSQSINQFGVGSIAASYLNAIEENDQTILPIPISFTPAGKRIQSVLLSELKDIFYKLTLPGGAFTQFSAAGLYTIDKNKFTADSQLKSYRVHLQKSKQYDSAEEAMKDFSPEEIYKPWNPKTGIVEYFDFTPAEAMVPWLFKDGEGKLLDYDTYVKKDGTPKKDMFDPRLFEFSAFRVPNTGPNSSIRMRAVKFIRPGYGDGIATAPEVVAIIGADFDYDKLYSYMYNYKMGKAGKLEKVESVLHATQDKQDFQSEESRRQFAKNQLMKTEKYRELKYRYKQAKAAIMDLDRQLHELLQANDPDAEPVNMQSLAEMKVDVDTKQIQRDIRLMEDEFMQGETFDKDYGKANIYEKQSVAALENALIDRFNLILGDFKTLKHMTTPTSSKWLQDQLESNIVPSVNEKGVKKMVSINNALNDNKYHSITSFNTFNNSRLANSSAALVIAMAANAQISQFQGQRWNLHINQAGYLPEFRNAHMLRFNDSKGNLKQEDEANRNNSSYPSIYNPYKLETDKKLIYEAPEDGRYRLDRIWTIDDSGNKVQISTVIQSILQAALDHQKNPLIDKASINPGTLNAAIAMARLGYVDEIVPLLKQEAVNDYVLGISNYYSIENQQKRTEVLVGVMAKYTTDYGYDAERLWNIFNGLSPTNRTAPIFIQSVMDRLDPDRKATLNTKDLLLGVSQRAGLAPRDENYSLRQLEALRSYIVADVTGRQLFNVQNSTAAYTKGLKTSFAGMDLQDMMFKALFTYNKKSGYFKSSAPLIGGLHRVDRAWAGAVKRPKEFRPTMMSFGQFYGLEPSKKLLDSVQGSIFTEFTELFKQARSEAFRTSIGVTPSSTTISQIGAREYERVFNKVNTNLVSFMFSNPQLYRNLIENPEEFALFDRYGIELITRPHEGIPYNENFALFNSATSLANQLNKFATEINPLTGNKYILDYDVLEALQSILNVSYKTPSSVVYNNTFGYQENVNHRIAMSLAEMYYSTNSEVSGVAKKLIMYAFMTGGITTPKSFVQFIPPDILIDMGFDRTLRAMLDEMKKKEFRKQTVNSFVIQYYQHFPFELKAEIKEGDLVHIDGTHLQKDKATGIVQLEISKFARDKFADKYIFRLENRIYVRRGRKYLMQIDNLGMTKWHRNEYQYNTGNIPGTSLYSHNISDASRVITDRVEVRGELTEPAEVSDETKDMVERMDTDLIDKLVDKPTDLYKLIEDIEMEKVNPTATSVLSMLRPILREAGVKLVYSNKEAGKYGSYINGEIHINLQNPDFKGLTSGDPAEMKLDKFIETVAHEATHAATVKLIEDVMTGKEKDPDKVQAVERIQALMDYSLKYIAKDPNMSKRHSLLLLQKEAAKQSKAKKDTAKQAEIRFVQEFVAYVFSNEQFQKDMNSIKLNSEETWWEAFIKQVLRLLGLDINETEAHNEITKIKKRLQASEPYLTKTGEASRRKTGELTETMQKLEAFSALHVALREIIAITDIAKNDFVSSQGAANIAAETQKISKQGKGKKLNMVDLYAGVSNFDPSWSEEMMEEYHKANLNRQILC